MQDATQAGLLEQRQPNPNVATTTGVEERPMGAQMMEEPISAKPFMPEAVRAEAVDLGAAIRASRDKRHKEAKIKELLLTAEVLIPGLPNGKYNADGSPQFGLVCKVKRFTGFEAGQVVYKSRQQPEPDDGALFKVPEELSSADAREGWWRDIWRLIYGCHPNTKRLLAAIALSNPDATPEMFGVNEAIYWMTCEESELVVDPLLQAIVILNLYAKGTPKTSSQLDDFKALPETIEQLIAAFKSGRLQEWFTGNPETVQFIVDNVKLITELQNLVAAEDAKRHALYTKDALKQAIREVWNEVHGDAPPTPTEDMREHLYRDEEAPPQEVRLSTGPVAQMSFGAGIGGQAPAPMPTAPPQATQEAPQGAEATDEVEDLEAERGGFAADKATGVGPAEAMSAGA